MDFNQYVNLLSSLASEAFTIWGLLATVSLGVIAFIGSLRHLTIPFGLTMCLVFAFFAATNFLALNKNFKSRQVVSEAAKANCWEEFKRNEDLVRRLDLTYDIDSPRVDSVVKWVSLVVKQLNLSDKEIELTVKVMNLALHIVLDVTIVLILLGFTLTRRRRITRGREPKVGPVAPETQSCQ